MNERKELSNTENHSYFSDIQSQKNMSIRVLKRDGKPVPVDFEKIHWRIKSMCALPEILEFQKRERPEAYEINKNLAPLLNVSADKVALKSFEGLHDLVPTSSIDILTAEIAQSLCTEHPEYSILAKRILVSNIQKNVLVLLCKRFPDVSKDEIKSQTFRYSMEALFYNKNKRGEHAPLVAPYILAIARRHGIEIQKNIDYSRDYTNYGYLGIKLLEKGYLFRCYDLGSPLNKEYGYNVIIETPQIAEMRIALAIIASPIPHNDWFNKHHVLTVIEDNPNCIKNKYVKNIDNVIFKAQLSDKPYKLKYFNVKELKTAYWKFMVKKERGDMSEHQWIDIYDTYNKCSRGYYTPATPTRFNYGTLRPQGSSCFLIAMEDDSLDGIYNTLKKQAKIAQYAGGVGMWIHNIRSSGSYIEGTNGFSNGVKPMLRVFNASSLYVDQGGGKRPGSTAVYLVMCHNDIVSFIRLRLKQGDDKDRARDLFTALWIEDEFMRTIKTGGLWYLFDPAVCPKLFNNYDQLKINTPLTDDEVNELGKEKLAFTYRYRKYIRQKRYESSIPIIELIEEIVACIRNTGAPYLMSKDAANRKSNQKNLGYIGSSNLCTEIIEYSDKNETAVCNLHSVCVNKCIREWREGDSEEFKFQVTLDVLLEKGVPPKYLTFDFDLFDEITERCVINLDKIISSNFYPIECTKTSNMKHRPMGLGVQGEADLMEIFRLRWESKSANKLRFYIFEQMYYTFIKTSIKLAEKYGKYESFEGSPASEGKLQFDLWLEEGQKMPFPLSKDWDTIKINMSKHGLRNSLGIAPMPTASTSGIMDNIPCFEPPTALVYNRKVGSGKFTLVNPHLVEDLSLLGLWNKKISDQIIRDSGSIQNIMEIPKQIRQIYMIAYEIDPKYYINAAFHRAWFVDQSQSLNYYIRTVTTKALTSAWTRAWRKGLKGFMYYCRSKSAADAEKSQLDDDESSKFTQAKIENKTVESETPEKPEVTEPEAPVLFCDRSNKDCLSCGS